MKIRDRIRRAIIEWLLPDLTDVVSAHVSDLGLVDRADLLTEIYSVREDAQAGFDRIEGTIR